MQQTLDKVVMMHLSDGSQLEFHVSGRLESLLRDRNGLGPNEELPEDVLKEFLLGTLQHAELEDD